APAMSIAKGSGGSVTAFLGSATVERKLFQTTLAVRESFTEGHLDSRELQPVAQAPLLGEHDPASKPRQPRLRLHARGEPIPVEPELGGGRSEEHTSELQSLAYLVCRLLLEKKKRTKATRLHESRVKHASRSPPSASAG